MPRVSREQTDQHRAAVVEASARLFRERGIDGVSVADLMAAVGLTHGGFYGHFDSKDALAAVACASAFAQSAERWRERMGPHENPRQAFGAIVERYLEPRNRDEAGQSCPAATLAADVARESSDRPVRQAYLAGVKGMVATLAGLAGDAPDARGQALVELSMMVGALVLARATQGDAISDEFLDSARKRLLDDTAKASPSTRRKA